MPFSSYFRLIFSYIFHICDEILYLFMPPFLLIHEDINHSNSMSLSDRSVSVSSEDLVLLLILSLDYGLSSLALCVL